MIVQFHWISRSALHSRNNSCVYCTHMQPAAIRESGTCLGASVSALWLRRGSNTAVSRCVF